MAELAKSFITISDESAYAAGVNTIIPLYIIATKSNKVLDASNGSIAPGTAIANELLVMTSQRDVINTFGVPSFTEVNGTVIQGDELNEVGLLSLYNAMGSSSLGYAVRADIDLAQLEMKETQPSQPVKNGTKWVDTSVSTFGVFRRNGSSSEIIMNQWDYVKTVICNDINEVEGSDNDIIFLVNDSTKEGDNTLYTGNTFYECFGSKWYVIGSSEWKEVVGTEPTFTFAKYNNMPGNQPQGSIWINTSTYNNGSTVVLKTYNTIISNWTSYNLPMYNSYIEAEDAFGSALTEGSMFILCGEESGDNILAKISIKEFKANLEEPNFIVTDPSKLQIGKTTLNEDDQLYGYYIFNYTGLDNTSEDYKDREGYCDCYQRDEEGNVKTKYKYGNPALNPDGTVKKNEQGHVIDENGDEILDDHGNPINDDPKVLVGTSVREIIVYFKKTFGNRNLDMKLTDGLLNIESTDGLSIGITTSSDFQNTSGITSQERVVSWQDADEVEISFDEPTDAPKEGTLWFDGGENVDILVNTGSKWKGLNEAHPGAKLYITSEEPKENVTTWSLWIDANAENYPTIYRYERNRWELLDNTDQTTAYGVLFADARWYDDNGNKLTFKYDDNGIVSGSVLESSALDPDAPKATACPREMILFNTRFSSKNVKKYALNPFDDNKPRWITASGNAFNGAGLFGSKAQRKLIVDALAGAINSCEELKSINYDFFYATCPGYPEIDNELLALNSDKKDMFYIISDTPKTLAPTVRAITDWGTNANEADHGLDGRVIRSMYITRQYPPMGMTSNVDGTAVAVPTSFVKMKNLLNLPKGAICAGTQYGVVNNVSSVGYITDEDEYRSISLSDGLGEAITAQSMNPIMTRRNTGLLLWGENTENNGNTSLSDEHAILTLLRLKRELDIAITPFFFRKNTKSTRDDFDYVIRTILTSYVTDDELYDFVLDTETPNTVETISRKELHANIAIEIVKGIEFIYIPIRVVNTGTLSEQSLSA